MTADDIRKYLPNASQSLIALNSGGAGKDAPAKPTVRDEPLAKVESEEADTAKFLIRATSVRKKLGDADGPIAKYYFDCCHYAGFVTDDNAKVCHLETRQRKVRKGEAEHVLVEIFQINQTQ